MLLIKLILSSSFWRTFIRTKRDVVEKEAFYVSHFTQVSCVLCDIKLSSRLAPKLVKKTSHHTSRKRQLMFTWSLQLRHFYSTFLFSL